MFLEVANIFAKYSCPMWCGSTVIRRICRKTYRWMAENRTLYRRAMKREGLSDRELDNHSALRFDVDTYPPLYADESFAPWEEIADPDDPKQYNLISCCGGQVIRWSTSYCAWKIFELTGQYPRRLSKGRYDARRWVKFLAKAGYTTIVDRPQAGHHYVGVIPEEGEHGQVVWFGMLGRAIFSGDEDEKLATMYSDEHSGFLIIPSDEPGADYFCSTYNNFIFEIVCIEHDRRDVTWVQID